MHLQAIIASNSQSVLPV